MYFTKRFFHQAENCCLDVCKYSVNVFLESMKLKSANQSNSLNFWCKKSRHKNSYTFFGFLVDVRRIFGALRHNFLETLMLKPSNLLEADFLNVKTEKQLLKKSFTVF